MRRQKLLLGIASAVIGAVTLVGSERVASTDDSEPSATDASVARDDHRGERRRPGRKATDALDPIFRQP